MRYEYKSDDLAGPSVIKSIQIRNSWNQHYFTETITNGNAESGFNNTHVYLNRYQNASSVFFLTATDIMHVKAILAMDSTCARTLFHSIPTLALCRTCCVLCALNVSVSEFRTHLAHVLCFVIEARCRPHTRKTTHTQKHPFSLEKHYSVWRSHCWPLLWRRQIALKY